MSMPRGTDCLSLSPAIVAELAERAARIKATLKRSLLEVGRELTEAKHVLSHGQFTSWVEREVGMSIRTAQLIMGAHRAILKNENFSLLPKSALYILGATDVPASTRAALSKRIEAGDIPSCAEVRTMLRTGSRGVNPVNVAVNMREPEAESKAPVVSMEAYRVLARVDELLEAADREGLHERVREFRNYVAIAEIAVMLSEILDDGQIYRLVTMLRKSPPDSKLDALADALEAMPPLPGRQD